MFAALAILPALLAFATLALAAAFSYRGQSDIARAIRASDEVRYDWSTRDPLVVRALRLNAAFAATTPGADPFTASTGLLPALAAAPSEALPTVRDRKAA